jgi:hypothetical protein
MTELNSMLSGNYSSFPVNSVQTEFKKLYGKSSMETETSEQQLWEIDNQGRAYRVAQPIKSRGVPYGYTPMFTWGQAVQPIPKGSMRPSLTGGVNQIPPAVIKETRQWRGSDESIEGAIARNAWVRNVA